MPRQRSPARDKAKEMYLKSKGKVKLKDIAEKFGVLDTQIRKWKSTDKWDKELKGTLPKKKRNVTNHNKDIKKEPRLAAVTELENTELTDKQRLFCSYYVKYRNKTKAYMKTYQCSYQNACSHAYEMWKNVGIQEEINRQLKELRDELKLDTQDIIQKYIDIAFADINDYVEYGQEEVPVMGPFGPIVDKNTKKVITKIVNTVKFNESAEVDGTIVSEVSQGRDGAKIKLYDKTKALDWLANHMDLLDTATREKLKLERDKFNADQMKKNEDGKDITIKVTLEDDES